MGWQYLGEILADANGDSARVPGSQPHLSYSRRKHLRIMSDDFVSFSDEPAGAAEVAMGMELK